MVSRAIYTCYTLSCSKDIPATIIIVGPLLIKQWLLSDAERQEINQSTKLKAEMHISGGAKTMAPLSILQ
jgi:hypothetical protein